MPSYYTCHWRYKDKYIVTLAYDLIVQHLCVCVCVSFSVMSDFLQPHQAPLSLGFSRKEYWSGLPFPFPGNLPDPGIEPGSPALQAGSLPSEPPGKPTLNNNWVC